MLADVTRLENWFFTDNCGITMIYIRLNFSLTADGLGLGKREKVLGQQQTNNCNFDHFVNRSRVVV